MGGACLAMLVLLDINIEGRNERAAFPLKCGMYCGGLRCHEFLGFYRLSVVVDVCQSRGLHTQVLERACCAHTGQLL